MNLISRYLKLQETKKIGDIINLSLKNAKYNNLIIPTIRKAINSFNPLLVVDTLIKDFRTIIVTIKDDNYSRVYTYSGSEGRVKGIEVRRNLVTP